MEVLIINMKNTKADMDQLVQEMDQVGIREFQVKLNQILDITIMEEARLERLHQQKLQDNLHKFIVRATLKETDRWHIHKTNIREIKTKIHAMDLRESSIRQK